MPPRNPAPQKLDIDALKKEHARLDREKTTAEANLKNANDNLAQLRDEAKRAFGTDDLNELKAKLAQMEADNEMKRAEYQAHLEAIDQKLNQIEQSFANKS